MRIKGIHKSEYPVLYAIVEKNMKAYGIDKIKVKIVENGYCAYARSFPKDHLGIAKRELEILNEQELDAVVAHEFSHLSNRDSSVMILIGLLFSIFLFGVLAILIFGRDKIFSDAAHFYFMLIYSAFSFYMCNLGLKIKSRASIHQEIRADLEAILKTKNPEALKNALYKIEIESIYTTYTRPGYFYALARCSDTIRWYFIGDTHPVITDRLGYLELAERMYKEKELKNIDIPTQKANFEQPLRNV